MQISVIQEKKGIIEKIKEKITAAKSHVQANKPEHEDGNEKGIIEKIREKLTGHNKHEDDDEKKKKGKSIRVFLLAVNDSSSSCQRSKLFPISKNIES